MADLFDKNLETLEDFMLRKVEWTKNHYIRRGQIPTLAQFRNKGILRNKTSFNSEKIQIATKIAMMKIKDSVEKM